ncbi:MAG: hypothetical protein C5B54_06090 [Acidobacteria bacterium]|nr:MAG: hypothetical protein C5B54_06090 [Acidobacteriota bacterium]
MFNKVDYIMVNVSDMGRSVAFYRNVLGLSLKFESPGWSEFVTGATTLALHHVGTGANESRGMEKPAAGTCSIGFSVQDLDAIHKELSKRGAKFVMPPTVQAEEGIKIAVCLDPDGLGISFAEVIARENR